MAEPTERPHVLPYAEPGPAVPTTSLGRHAFLAALAVAFTAGVIGVLHAAPYYAAINLGWCSFVAAVVVGPLVPWCMWSSRPGSIHPVAGIVFALWLWCVAAMCLILALNIGFA